MMRDEDKTKGQLIKELAGLQIQVNKLKKAETKLKQAKERLKSTNQQLVASEQQLKARENKLTESEMKFRNVINKAGLMAYDYHIDSGKLFIFGSTEKTTGYSEKEMAGNVAEFWEKMVHPDDRKRAYDLLDKSIETGERYDADYKIKHKNGSYVFVEDHGAFVFDKNGKPYCLLGIVININERKKAEVKIKASEQQLKAANQQMKAANQQLRASEQQLKAANQQLRASEQQLKAANQQLIASEQQLKERENKLTDSEMKFRNVINKADLMAYDYHIDSGKLFIFGSTEKNIGYSEKEMAGNVADIWEKMVHPDDRKRAYDLLDKSIETGERYDADYKIKHKNGSYVFVEDHGAFVFDKNGKPYRLLGIVININERKKAEEQIKASEQQLKAANQQLRASEQQLKAANQQLRASEQQLKAANQQLRASEQQLKAAIKQLRQSERELNIRNRIANIFLTVPYDEMYNDVLNVFLEAMESKYGVFGYLDEKRDFIVPSMTRHIWDKCDVPDKDFVFPRETWGDSTWPKAVKEKRTIYSNKPSTNIPKGHIAINNHISLPLIHQGEVIGLLQIANKKNGYNAKDIELFETIGKAIAPILNARLQRDRQEQKRRRAEDELKSSNQQLRASEQQLKAANQQLNASNQQLNASEQQLKGVNQQLTASNQQLRATEQQLVKSNYNLNKRVKELNCLYCISKIFERPNITLDEIFHGVINIIPPSWQYPEITGCRIIFEEKDYKTDNFKETKWLQRANIKIKNKVIGSVEVCYLMEKPEKFEGPFLREEKDLIDAIAKELSAHFEHKKAVEALVVNEERLRLAQASANEGIWEWNVQTGQLDWTEELESIYGYTQGTFPGDYAGFSDRVHPDDLAYVEARRNEAVAAHRSFDFDFRILLPSGMVRWVNCKGAAKYDDTGAPLCVFGVNVDITKRKKAEEELKRYSEHLEEIVNERTKELIDTQEQLIQKEKLAVLGQLSGSIAHELRNPLGGIRNAAYFLNMELEKPSPDVKKTLEIIDKEVANSDRIITSLLDYARSKEPTLKKVEINDIIQNTLTRIIVPENIDVVNQLDKVVPTLFADSNQLSQVFENIMLNAIQAMPEGGKIKIFSKITSPEQVTISITDSGVGISKENLEKLFEPLFTTKAKGIGLGLSLCMLIIKAHGGTIEVESEVGKGSTFKIMLPIGKKK